MSISSKIPIMGNQGLSIHRWLEDVFNHPSASLLWLIQLWEAWKDWRIFMQWFIKSRHFNLLRTAQMENLSLLISSFTNTKDQAGVTLLIIAIRHLKDLWSEGANFPTCLPMVEVITISDQQTQGLFFLARLPPNHLKSHPAWTSYPDAPQICISSSLS